MVFEEEFFYAGHLRWSFGWPTPNYAGAFLAALIPWIWLMNVRGSLLATPGDVPGPGAGTGPRFWRAVGGASGWALELVVWYCIAKTYSRGALVAALAALAGWHWLRRGPRPPGGIRRATSGKGLGATLGLDGRDLVLRLAMVAGCLLGTGFAGRVALPALAADRAVANRWELWKGGTEMIAAAPLAGWGAGESGRAYMNWFQDLDRNEGYATTVNSFLHVAVEHGLPALSLVLFSGLGLLLTGRELSRTNSPDRTGRGDAWRRAGAAGAVASLLSWAAANVFTTLWIEWSLWPVPVVAILSLAVLSRRNRRALPWGRIATASAVGTALLVGGLSSAGWLLRSDRAWQPAPGSGDTVVVRFRDAPSVQFPKVWHVWPDPAVLGPAPGKELRRWVETLPASTMVVAHRPHPPGTEPDLGDADGVMLVGRQAERLGQGRALPCRQLWLVHPSGLPPSRAASPALGARPAVTVVLPSIDESGEAAVWRGWADMLGVRVLISPGTGQDIRAAWPIVAGSSGNIPAK